MDKVGQNGFYFSRASILMILIGISCLLDIGVSIAVISPGIHSIAWILTSIAIIVLLFSCISFNLSIYSKYILLIVLLILYDIICVFRGMNFSLDYLKTVARQPYNFWPFIIPFICLVRISEQEVIQMARMFVFFGVVFLLIGSIFPNVFYTQALIERFVASFASGCALVILLAAFHFNRKQILFAYLVVFVALGFLVFHARRNGVITYGGFIFAGFFMSFKSKRLDNVSKYLPLFIFLALVFSFVFDNLYLGVTKSIRDRVLDDSRSELFQSFFFEMEGHESFGKGLNGTYYYPLGYNELDDGTVFEDVEFRNVIENGFLQLYLTGGLIRVFLYIIVFLSAIVHGILFSKSFIKQVSAIMILLWLLDMFIYGLPTLSVHYVLVWICVGVCFRKDSAILGKAAI